MLKILTFIDAQLQLTQACVELLTIQQTDTIEETILRTEQCFDVNMLDIFFNQLNIQRPDTQLDIHSGDKTVHRIVTELVGF